MSENERPALVRRSSSFGRYGGGGEKCALCAKTVYVAERAVAQDKIFHVACFRCKECNVKLTLSSWCMDPCGGLWCKPHFMQALKTSGGTLTVNTDSERSPPSTPRRSDSSNGKSAATPQRPLAPATAHGETRSPAHVPSPAPTPAPAPVCTPVPAPATASPAPRSGSKIMRSSSFGRFGGGGEKCTRCNKTVYAAERVSAKDQVFHNTCFRCIECNIKLSPSNWRGRPPTREHVRPRASTRRHHRRGLPGPPSQRVARDPPLAPSSHSPPRCPPRSVAPQVHGPVRRSLLQAPLHADHARRRRQVRLWDGGLILEPPLLGGSRRASSRRASSTGAREGCLWRWRGLGRRGARQAGDANLQELRAAERLAKAGGVAARPVGTCLATSCSLLRAFR